MSFGHTLFILGDSTAAEKTGLKRPETGWGESLEDLNVLKKGWRVKNLAQDGRSTKSFINESLFDSFLSEANKGDSVIIQFGHNDEKLYDEKRGVTVDEFIKNLSFMTGESKRKGLEVYTLTSIPRRNFRDTELIDTHNEYRKAPLIAAFESNVEGVDINLILNMFITFLGEEKSKKLFNHTESKEDNTHFSPFGAHIISLLITLALYSRNASFLSIDRKEDVINELKKECNRI